MVQWSLSGHMWLECVDSSWIKALCHRRAMFLRSESNQEPLGRYVQVSWHFQIVPERVRSALIQILEETIYLYQEHAQMLSRLHAGTWGTHALWRVFDPRNFDFSCDFESSPQKVHDFSFHWLSLYHFVTSPGSIILIKLFEVKAGVSNSRPRGPVSCRF